MSESSFNFLKKAWGIGVWELNIQNSGIYEAWLKNVFSEDLEYVKNTITKATLREAELEFDFRFYFEDKSLRCLQVVAQIIRDEKGQAISFKGFSKDISAEKNIEKLIAAKSEELNSLLYTITHDLRAPLRGIDGWSLALLEDCGDGLDEKGHAHLKRVRHEAHYLSGLIDDLLKISTIFNKDVKYEKVNLSYLVEKNSPKSILIKIEPGVEVTGDKDLLDILMQNFLENSIKFAAKSQEIKIDFGKKVIDEENVYFIRDNGVGFNMVAAKKLFGIFQKLHKPQDYSGNGIGLAIAKRIINLHQGRVWAESSVNMGTTFYFTLNAIGA